ncbi:TetR/AcrR family transcriptional regulator [Isoptericola sp. NPDC057191]|uniref:TetR/AcrR family transcriptional regulator n=1 Tax=Isoptericola sp. NPDC057191 TaxID=3346041 RepID=UPI0036373F34
MSAPRPMRADARRNRARIVAVAREELAAHGGSFAMDTVAARAGVGAGTLYRHFPTREALVETVYAAELEDLTTSSAALLDALAPIAALREWLTRYTQFAATKRGMIDTLRAGTSESQAPMKATRERITTAVAPLLEAGVADGSLRSDIRPDDVTVLLHGLFVATATRSDVEQIARLLDLVVDALRRRD